MIYVPQNPGNWNENDFKGKQFKCCKRCGGVHLTMTWSKNLHWKGHDGYYKVKYGIECYNCEELNTTWRKFDSPLDAVNEWNRINSDMPYMPQEMADASSKTKQATIGTDTEILKTKW